MANATKGGVAMADTKASTRRQQRQEAIRGIVRAEGVKTQRDLADKLHEAGFKCTQATVSRDIVEMGLKKAPDGCYALPEEERLARLVTELVCDVKVGCSIVVIKTLPGGAQGVCAALDAAHFPGALGTVAGDDTIMIAAESFEAADQVARMVERLRRR